MLNSMKWVILFGGAGREDCILRMLDEGVKVSAIIVPMQRNAKLELAVLKLRNLSCELVETDKVNLDSALKIFAGSALLSIGFPYLLPKSLFSLFSPALNIHPTLLPRFRGPTSGAYILIQNERESGSTVHHMTEKMDGGDIVTQSRVALTPFDTIRSLQRKVYGSEPQLFVDALLALENGIKPTPQDESKSSEFKKKRTPIDSEIDPYRPLSELVDQIRACDPEDYPAFFMHCGERVNIKIWRPDKPESENDLI